MIIQKEYIYIHFIWALIIYQWVVKIETALCFKLWTIIFDDHIYKTKQNAQILQCSKIAWNNVIKNGSVDTWTTINDALEHNKVCLIHLHASKRASIE